VRGRVAKITEGPGGDPTIWYEEVADSTMGRKEVDLAVLATSFVPRRGTKELAKILGVELDEYGFFMTDPSAPLDSIREGIFVCGCCREPVDIPDSVAQASGAAAKAAEIVTGGYS
ncbi:MAG: CoB--CoM heterodisulfide reductase iron-sulfur subunit A family protein, partial [Planctomycetota bacterium]|jgi:heterodisulfide reductase subunit A